MAARLAERRALYSALYRERFGWDLTISGHPGKDSPHGRVILSQPAGGMSEARWQRGERPEPPHGEAPLALLHEDNYRAGVAERFRAAYMERYGRDPLAP